MVAALSERAWIDCPKCGGTMTPRGRELKGAKRIHFFFCPKCHEKVPIDYVVEVAPMNSKKVIVEFEIWKKDRDMKSRVLFNPIMPLDPYYATPKGIRKLLAAQPKMLRNCDQCGKAPKQGDFCLCSDCEADGCHYWEREGEARGRKEAFAEVRRWNTKNINAPITWLLLERWLDEKTGKTEVKK
jgi:DNA-directed RNA polymerase subunit M/transcription elongation factor TFIIS